MITRRDDNPPNVLVVGDRRTPALAKGFESLIRAGVSAVFASDVYEAMAVLALRPTIRRLLIDIRGLDGAEADFLTLAPRYFPSVDITVPLLERTGERVAMLGVSRRVARVEDFVSEVLGGGAQLFRAADSQLAPPPSSVPNAPNADFGNSKVDHQSAPEEPGTTDQPIDADERDVPRSEFRVPGSPRGPRRPLSTDGGFDAAEKGPTLHESVRMRMGGNDPRTVRRRPPGAGPATPPASRSSHLTGADAALSREELDALLNDEPTNGKPDAADNQDGASP